MDTDFTHTDLRHTDLRHIVALSHLTGLGAGSYCKLQALFDSPSAIYLSELSHWPLKLNDQATSLWRDYQRDMLGSKLGIKVEKDLTWCERNGIEVLTHADERYPYDLKQIPRYPPVLYVKGDVSSLSLPQVAIIGSRKPTELGRRNAVAFSAHLAASGFGITSGLALGIDGAAHQGALDVGGSTLAVLGTGIDKVYPYRHRKLAQQIVNTGGALVSEFPVGTAACAANFPQRNRIISGLSSGVLVVEAAIKSGSLITAKFALQHNREVFAIPGSIHNPLAVGCHSLIKQGASLVENCQDIVDQLNGYLLNKQLELDSLRKVNSHVNTVSAASDDEKELLALLEHDAISFDDLVERSGEEVSTLNHLILCMEMKGLIVNEGGLYSSVVTNFAR